MRTLRSLDALLRSGLRIPLILAAGAVGILGAFQEPLGRRELSRDRTLEGVVTLPGGTPCAGAVVRFFWNDRGRLERVRDVTDSEGRFLLVTDQPGVTGALHALARGYHWRSTAVDPISAGTTGIELALGEPRRLTIDARDQDDRPVEVMHASYSWHLAGFEVPVEIGPRRKRTEAPWWELPNVPFYVDLRARGHEITKVGPLDPDTVGEMLRVTLRAHPRLRGRVVYELEPVEGALVYLRRSRAPTLDVELSPVPYLGWYQPVSTDGDGRFDLPVDSRDAYELRAWSESLGEGVLGPVDLDPEDLPGPVEIDLVRAPGAIAGKVVLPAGHEPWEILLATAMHSGVLALEPDGSFLTPGLPPGRVTLRIRPGGKAFQRPGEWQFGTHGSSRAPKWLEVEPTFDVEVPPGGLARAELDLDADSTCRLEGMLLLDGAPPLRAPARRHFAYVPPPRVVLDRGGSDYVSRTDLAEDGSFTLTANEPGTYRLRIDHAVMEEHELVVLDRVDLRSGVTSWVLDLPTGSLRILPETKDGAVGARSGKLRWEGPRHLRVFGLSPLEDEDTREAVYPVVPAGPVQVLEDVDGERRILFEAEVAAGEETVVSNPRRGPE